MLTTDQSYVLTLLRESLGVQEKKESTFTEAHEVINIIQRNSILPTVFQQLPDELKNTLRGAYYTVVMQAVNQQQEGLRILKALSEAGFVCIALKGWELQKLYPGRNMRQMADLDILVKPYEFLEIKKVMDTLGFSGGSGASWKHDSFWKNAVHVEMHKRLTDDSGAIQTWEKSLWERTSPVENNIYRMSPEDYYIFHFVHLHKDFLNGSLGLRRIVDTWLLQKQPLNMDVVRSYLESFGMWRFHERMVKLSRVAMGEEELDEDTELLLKHAFKHGIYGSGKSYKAGRIVLMGESLEKGKLKSKVAAILLPYNRMKAQFPILEKWPVLLPYCWGKRIVHYLNKNKRKSLNMLNYKEITKADFEEMRRLYEAGGI